MQRTAVVPALALLVSLASPAWAKAPTARITLTCQGLPAPIELTDTLALGFRFGPWGGGFLGPSGSSQAVPPAGFRVCEVSFYAQVAPRQVRLAYVAYFAYDPHGPSAPSYVYLPGPRDPWRTLNAGTMLRADRDGTWQAAAPSWATIVQSAIARVDGTLSGP